jgi:hypothetical protein
MSILVEGSHGREKRRPSLDNPLRRLQQDKRRPSHANPLRWQPWTGEEKTLSCRTSKKAATDGRRETPPFSTLFEGSHGRNTLSCQPTKKAATDRIKGNSPVNHLKRQPWVGEEDSLSCQLSKKAATERI